MIKTHDLKNLGEKKKTKEKRKNQMMKGNEIDGATLLQQDAQRAQ